MTDHLIFLGNAILDLQQRDLFFQSIRAHLTTMEFALIQVLADRFRDPVSRDDISLRLWGKEWNGITRAIDVGVARLRRKLRHVTYDYLDIRTARNVGYYLIEDSTHQRSNARV